MIDSPYFPIVIGLLAFLIYSVGFIIGYLSGMAKEREKAYDKLIEKLDKDLVELELDVDDGK